MPTSPLPGALRGVSGIVVAPFDADDRLDPPRFGAAVDRAIAAGVHTLVANGNTGEFYSLRPDEASAMVEALVAAVDGRLPVIGGVGRSVHEAAALARVSRQAGAAAIMVHQPPDPFVAPRGVVAYVERVAKAAGGLPLVLYLRNDRIGVDAIANLCAVPGVIAVKWATPNPMMLKAAMAAAPGHIVWVGGLAEVWAPAFYALGARGFTSGIINVWPERSVAIHAALEAGRWEAARDLIGGMQVFEDIRADEQGGANVAGVKAALKLMGEDCGAARPPACWPLAPDRLAAMAAFMEANGLAKGAAR